MLGRIYFCSRTPIESSPAIMDRNTCSCTVLTRIQLCRANFTADTLAGIAIHTLRHAASTCIRTAVEDACSIRNARGPTFTIFHQSAEQNEKCCFEQKEKKWEPQFLELESHRYSADYRWRRRHQLSSRSQDIRWMVWEQGQALDSLVLRPFPPSETAWERGYHWTIISELRPLRFIAQWKVLLIAVQFQYNTPHMDFIALAITKTLRRTKRSPLQVQGSLCFLIRLMEVWKKTFV